MSLPHDVSRCAGRPHGLGADDPICERRATCARYRDLLAWPEGEPVWIPVAMGLCRDGDFYMGEGA
jgi:hypothetical protein